MRKRYLTLPVVAAFVATTAVADAHHPEITATAGCIANARASVFVTATAWQTGDPAHRVNNSIAIERWTGTGWEIVGSGAFTVANPSFITPVTLAADITPVTARLRARATAPWGPNGEHGNAGETRETTVTVTRFCTTDTPATTTTVPALPPSTTLIQTAPEPKLPPVVTSSTVQVRPSLPEAPPAVVIVANPKFTG